MPTVEIDVFGTTFLSRKLNAIGDRAGDLEPVLESVADDMRDHAKRAFDSRGLTSGAAWPPLSPDTIARKSRDKSAKIRSNASRVLHATETLRNSLTVEGHKDHVSHADHNSLTYSTNVPYAIFHQEGTRLMPARPPVRLREFQRKRVVRKVERWIMTGIVT
jgi:phage gpG-like protein